MTLFSKSLWSVKFPEFAFDLWNRTDTRGCLLPHEIPQVPERENYGYITTSSRLLKRIFKNLPIRSTDVFLDIGCGKGKALLVASKFPFGKIIGLEKSPLLARIAGKNMAGHSQSIVVEDDAMTFCIPSDVNYIYLFNPFPAEIFAKCIEQITFSLRQNNRNLTLIYKCPTHLSLLESAAGLKIESSIYHQQGDFVILRLRAKENNEKNCLIGAEGINPSASS